MISNNKVKSYFELSKHSAMQPAIFIVLIAVGIVIAFVILLPLLKDFFEIFLGSIVYNETGDFMPYSLERDEPRRGLSYLFSWAVDIYHNTAEEARYWFNPLLAFFLQVGLFSAGIAIIISSLLPRDWGYIRQKIDREIANAIEKIALIRYGVQTENELVEIIDEVKNADIRALHDLVEELNIPFEDLRTLKNAIKWSQSSFIYRIMHINDGIRIYMRFFFTIKFSNAILGLVYMGAAVLIIIIGLRGLKFIPPTQPTLVIFALGLEFSLLIIYAIFLMYSRPEEESEFDKKKDRKVNSQTLGRDFGSSQEVESLLRVFINKIDKYK